MYVHTQIIRNFLKDIKERLTNVGHIHTKTMTKVARVIVKKYFTHLSNNLYTKCVWEEITIMPKKKLSNKISIYVTHLMIPIHRGPVRGLFVRGAERCQIMFLGLQPWIRRSLRLILTPRKSNASGLWHLL